MPDFQRPPNYDPLDQRQLPDSLRLIVGSPQRNLAAALLSHLEAGNGMFIMQTCVGTGSLHMTREICKHLGRTIEEWDVGALGGDSLESGLSRIRQVMARGAVVYIDDAQSLPDSTISRIRETLGSTERDPRFGLVLRKVEQAA